AEMLGRIPKPSFNLDWAPTCEQALEAIGSGRYDVLLLDYFLGSANGLDLLGNVVVRKCGAPVIVLTTHGQYELDIRAMEAGATDFLVKGEFDAPLLERSIRYAIDRKQTEEELKQHRNDLETLVRQRTIQHAEARADAEKRAIEAERRQAILEALLEHIPEGIAIVNSPELSVQAISRYALEMAGLSREEFERRYFTCSESSFDGSLREAAEFPLTVLDSALSGEVVSNQEKLLKTPHGERVSVLVSAGPIHDSSGNTTGAIAAWRDISELKHVQEELKRARDEMEQRVYQRTLELAETLVKLKESREELKYLASQLIRAQEDERKRIARDMHDSIGSSLSAVKFCLECAANQSAENSIRPETLQQLSSAMEQAIEESRRIMTDLRPSILDDIGVIPTVNWFCRRYESIYSDISVEKKIDIEEEIIPEHLKITIFRIIQEAMNNSAKYSQARNVMLSLTFADDRIELGIEDDGIGFNPETVTRGDRSSFGLTYMRERAELSGGSLEIVAAPGKGTLIRATWNCGGFLD
ncbi:MAG: histidine kinase, partial [Desulfobacteraceae bacterium]|nr:histidine kinase [Desulfobacteraceae bacterium]